MIARSQSLPSYSSIGRFAHGSLFEQPQGHYLQRLAGLLFGLAGRVILDLVIFFVFRCSFGKLCIRFFSDAHWSLGPLGRVNVRYGGQGAGWSDFY
jgi:hypothetical protein